MFFAESKPQLTQYSTDDLKYTVNLHAGRYYIAVMD